MSMCDPHDTKEIIIKIKIALLMELAMHSDIETLTIKGIYKQSTF